jgi:FtsP/CotA-like multicopper oxidase with cupredoxin domain
MRTIDINGKSATVMGLEQANGKEGLILPADLPFDVLLQNKLSVPTAIHWHGLHPPNNQDGVPGLTQQVIAPNATERYYFPLRPSGTHWMHSHLGLQEAFLLSAPLIAHASSEQSSDEQEVILFLGDFSFTPPLEIFANLRKPKSMEMSGSTGHGKADTNDVEYDAYLANDRSLTDPEVARVGKNARLRLRIINGSSGTNFFVSLGALKGELIATDGMPVKPVTGSRFPVAIAQRIDIRLELPSTGTFPILALREGSTDQTGIILATSNSPITKLPVRSAEPAGALDSGFESQLEAARPLPPKPIDRTFDLHLQGNMTRYEWPINGVSFDVAQPRRQKAQVQVRTGQRIAIKFFNDTGMSHPMHLHGHSFQVIEVNGKRIHGALRDTVLVPPKTTLTVAFDADNPGVWYLHCHVLWHLAAGMATLVQYES